MSVFKNIAANLAGTFQIVVSPVVRLYNHQQAYHRITYPGHDPVNPQPTFWDRDFSHLNRAPRRSVPDLRLVK